MLFFTIGFFAAVMLMTDDIWINVIFVSVMAIILLLNYAFALKRARTLIKDFDNATKKVKEYSQKKTSSAAYLTKKNFSVIRMHQTLLGSIRKNCSVWIRRKARQFAPISGIISTRNWSILSLWQRYPSRFPE